MKIETFNTGVSVILCCYNSSKRIKDSLQALSKQEFFPSLLWEIILVDNASTDNTAEIAERTWASFNSGIQLHVVQEPQPGLANARSRGINSANYSILLFCDDDNWLCKNYIQGIYDILSKDTVIAACGGKGIPVFETVQPKWFEEYAEAYALGSQDITSENGQLLSLYGAGLAIRKKNIDQLYKTGFKPLLQGRVGKLLSSSEDIELTYALVLMGYSLYYAKELYFYHYLPKERLRIEYLKKLFIAFGNDGPIRNLYYSHISNRFFHRQIGNWIFHLTLSLFRLVKYLIVPPKKNGRTIYFHWSIAYIKKLISIRSSHSDIITNIKKIQNTSTPKSHYRFWLFDPPI